MEKILKEIEVNIPERIKEHFLFYGQHIESL